jgi:hypothetical protein
LALGWEVRHVLLVEGDRAGVYCHEAGNAAQQRVLP